MEATCLNIPACPQSCVGFCSAASTLSGAQTAVPVHLLFLVFPYEFYLCFKRFVKMVGVFIFDSMCSGNHPKFMSLVDLNSHGGNPLGSRS